MKSKSLIKGRTRAKRELPKYLEEKDALTLLQTPYKAHIDHILMIWTGLHGLRASEIINLRVKDINLEERYLTVRQGKGGKDRIVPLSPELCTELSKYIKIFELSPESRLWDITRQGLYSIVRRYGKLSGIEERRGDPVTPHTLRHTYGVASVNAGIDIRTLQKTMGHSDLSTTAIYLDVTARDVREKYRSNPLQW